jgi:integrase
MVKRRAFTDPFIRALKAKATPYKLSEHAPKGEGRLIVRVLPSGVKEFFYRYRPSGEDKTLALGRYDQAGRNGKTLAGIRKALRENRDLQRDTGDVKEYRQAEARKQDVEARRGSFEQLLGAYVAYLRAEKRESADQVETIFKRHIVTPFPLLKAAKASEIEPGDVQRILAKMVNAGLTRQVNKTRSYLRAAFAYGGRADHDPRTVAADGVLFALKSNPVTLVPVIQQYERVGERTLSEDELRAYWKALESLPLAQRATLRFNLALACQRPTQLIRADWPDFNFSEATLLLRDPKGRGGSRDHLLPLPAFALEQLKPLRQLNAQPLKAGEKAPPPFSTDGKRRLATDTLSRAVADISANLKKSDKIPLFQQRDLRRTAETMLQKLGIDKEVRAHLLSHGRSKGVQGKHYERYDFLPEKRQALERWAAQLQRIIEATPASKVVRIRPTAQR